MLIKSVMLIALGFLSALLIALIFAPALWQRAVRLTTQRIRASLPMTMNEIQADKDRLRADFAIRIRKFEVALEREKLKTARQLVEISRRESDIKSLGKKIDDLERELEEQQNANRVYAQTISRRLPRMETQLDRAKELLGVRYNEIAKLRTTINRQENKIGEAETKSQMRKAEVDRLRVALETNSSDSVEEEELAGEELVRAETRNRELEEEVAKLRAVVDSEEESDAEEIEEAEDTSTTELQTASHTEAHPERSSLADTEVSQVVKRLLSGFNSLGIVQSAKRIGSEKIGGSIAAKSDIDADSKASSLAEDNDLFDEDKKEKTDNEDASKASGSVATSEASDQKVDEAPVEESSHTNGSEALASDLSDATDDEAGSNDKEADSVSAPVAERSKRSLNDRLKEL